MLRSWSSTEYFIGLSGGKKKNHKEKHLIGICQKKKKKINIKIFHGITKKYIYPEGLKGMHALGQWCQHSAVRVLGQLFYNSLHPYQFSVNDERDL